MKKMTKYLVFGLLMLAVGAGSMVVTAAEPETTQLINTTITHLEAALASVNANDLAIAKEHTKAAGQSSKLILGGRLEARKQAGSKAITQARQQLEKGNSEGAADAIRAALEEFKSLHGPDTTGNQGGL